jgi:trigger factor
MEIPDRMVEGQIDNMVQDTARRMESQGLNMDLYMKYTGMTMEQMREQMKPQALKRIQTRLVLEEVVKAENLQVSDERLDEEIAKMAAAYQMEADKLKGYMSDRDKDQMKEDIAVQEAVDFLVAEAKLV